MINTEETFFDKHKKVLGGLDEIWPISSLSQLSGESSALNTGLTAGA